MNKLLSSSQQRRLIQRLLVMVVDTDPRSQLGRDLIDCIDLLEVEGCRLTAEMFALMDALDYDTRRRKDKHLPMYIRALRLKMHQAHSHSRGAHLRNARLKRNPAR